MPWEFHKSQRQLKYWDIYIQTLELFSTEKQSHSPHLNGYLPHVASGEWVWRWWSKWRSQKPFFPFSFPFSGYERTGLREPSGVHRQHVALRAVPRRNREKQKEELKPISFLFQVFHRKIIIIKVLLKIVHESLIIGHSKPGGKVLRYSLQRLR